MKQINLKAPAKLNLFLEVLSRRRDGFHNLKTIFEKIDLCDDIILTHRSDSKIKIISRGHQIPRNKNNLAHKAARLIREDLGIKQGVNISINKRIPIACGLGGGSSDAAAVLLGLNKLWKLSLNRKKLVAYGAKLGSDVSFFLYDYAFACASSRGDNIRPILNVKQPLWHILVVPYSRLKTHFIYNEFDKISANVLTNKNANVKILTSGLRSHKLSLIKQGLFNRLEGISLEICPQIKRVKKILSGLGVCAISMSGKGPAVFGILSSRKEGEQLKRQLVKLGIGDIFLVKTKTT